MSHFLSPCMNKLFWKNKFFSRMKDAHRMKCEIFIREGQIFTILSIYASAAHIGHGIDRQFVIYNAFNLYFEINVMPFIAVFHCCYTGFLLPEVLSPGAIIHVYSWIFVFFVFVFFLSHPKMRLWCSLMPSLKHTQFGTLCPVLLLLQDKWSS